MQLNELARQLGIHNRKLSQKLEELGIKHDSYSARLSPEAVALVKATYAPAPQVPKPESTAPVARKLDPAKP